jgi:hypothetical protein
MTDPAVIERLRMKHYLIGLSFIRRKYREYPANPAWGHEHCEFCWKTFSLADSSEVLKEGYTTEDDYYWICIPCFDRFREAFRWQIIQDNPKFA